MDDKQKKVDTGKALLGSYQREKQEKVSGKGGDYHGSAAESTHDYFNQAPGKVVLETKKEKMDLATLHKRTAQFETLTTTIKKLEESLSEKDETINALKIEIQVLRKGGNGDNISVPENDDSKMICDLQKRIDSRDLYIQQLSDSLHQRSEELKQAKLQEKELTHKLHISQQNMETKSKQYELKISSSFNEAIEFKGKAEQLAKQMKDYSDLVLSLRVSLESSTKKADHLQEELNVRSKKLEQYKNQSSNEIKQLMRQVETLNHELSEKEKEVYNKNKNIQSIRNQMEEDFGIQLAILKKELEKKYAEDVEKVERIYDEMQLKILRNPLEDNKVIEKCNDLEAQISSCKLECEEEIKIYKDELKQLILKSKATEETLMQDLERHKMMAERYRQQVENVENKLAEEVTTVRNECYLVVENFKAEANGKMVHDREKINHFQQEIDRLSIQLKDYALKEARAEVEIESYREQLAKSESDISSLLDNLNKFKEAYEEQKVTIALLDEKLVQYQNIIAHYKSTEQMFKQNEQHLIHENNINKAKIQDYVQTSYELDSKIKSDSEKYNSVVTTFEIQLQQLMSELERNKAKYADDIAHLNSITNEQQNEIKNLEAKIIFILEKSKSDIDHMEVLNDRSPQMNRIKQQLLSANKVKETNKGFLLSILKGLRKLKTSLKVIIGPNPQNCDGTSETSDMEDNKDILSYEELIVELEKTLCDIQNSTQCSLQNVNALIKSPGFVPKKNMITSTPHVKDFVGACFDSPPQDQSSDLTNTGQSSCGDCEGWKEKCLELETENQKLCADITSLLENEKEMEYCLLVATQEAATFNQQCMSLDAKITELEKSKLSDHLMKRENYDLKTKIISLEQSEQKLHQELQKASENYITLQHMYNNSISSLGNKLAENGPNQELEQCLMDLKQKSEEVIILKTQIVNLQKSEQEYKARAIDIQNKYEQLIAKQKFLESELNKNKKELNDSFQEKNLLGSENNVLKTKLKSLEENTKDNKISSIPFFGGLKLARQMNSSGKEKEHLSSDLNSLSKNRLHTFELLASSRNTPNNSSTKTRSSGQSIAEQIDFDLLQLQYDDRTHGLHMPTILEDVEDESPSSSWTNNEHAQAEISLSSSKRRFLLENRSKWALKTLLTALFHDYSSTLKKLNLWREEFDTFDYNLIEYLDQSITSTTIKEDLVNLSKVEEREEENSSPSHTNLTKSLGALKRTAVDCVKAMFYLKVQLIATHENVLSSINISKVELEEASLVEVLRDKVRTLKTEKDELDKKHKSAIELLIKDHETELGLVRNLLTSIQKNNCTDNTNAEETDKIKKDLEQKHSKELEELRTYYEKRCADLVKHYSEEIYSQSQQSCKVSVSSSSSMENIADLYSPGTCEEEEANHIEEVEGAHELCNKKVAEFQDLLENMKEKYKRELESVKGDYELQLRETICKACDRNLTNGEEVKSKQSGISLEQYYTEKIQDLGDKYSSSNVTKDLELKVYQIKEEVRKDYECELDRMREEIIAKELQRKDEEIKLIKTQLNEAHKLEIEKMWRRYEELASKEAENSMVRVKNEVILSQELEDKVKLTEQLQNEKKELLKQRQIANEERQKEQEQLRLDLNQACRKEKENMMQAFEIEIETRVETVVEEKLLMEEKLKKEIQMLREELSKIQSDTEDYQDNQDTNLQRLTESVRKDILCLLEQQIKAMVEAGEEERDECDWPEELVSLERLFTAGYQQQLSCLVEEHALEMAETKADYDAKLAHLVKEYSLKQVEDMSLAAIANEEEDITAIIRERDSLRCLVLTLRQVVQELTRYLTSCEDELNKSFLSAMLNVASPQKQNKVQISEVDVTTSDSDCDIDEPVVKKVHFAPDVSSIVSLIDEDCLFENSTDVSLHLRSQLEGCLQRLKNEAVSVLGLTQTQNRVLPSSVEDRRLSSVTRQLIEEKKAKEEANNKLSHLQELVDKYEKELNDVHKELVETKDSMTKEKVAVEAEFNERQAERRTNKLSLLQEKARNLLFGREDCPPQWLNLIEDMFAEGDLLIEEARKARDELQLEVEAADKQLRSTRAFLEEQATEREQERDEYTREIARLTDQLRERDREWTSHRQFVSEWDTPQVTDSLAATCTDNSKATVDALELQVRDTSELLKETEEKNGKLEKELKAANDKIWVLRDIISELEVQVSSRCEREVTLERRLAELENELESRTKSQVDILSELQALRDCSGDHANAQQQLSSLHDQLQGQKHNNAYVVRQMKSQLRTIGRSLERQIKELEAVNIHVSSASLSSPSEDVSIREHLEALRCATPEERPRSEGSPPSPLTVEEINQLSEKLLRYSRAAEVLIKTLRDRDMEIKILKAQQEELQAERDVAQSQAERQVLQLASMNNKLEELRRRTEHDVESSVTPLHQHIVDLESQITSLNDELREYQRQAAKMRQKLDRSEAVVQSHEAELSSLFEHQHQLVSRLNEDLAAMRAEKQQLQKMVEKFQHEEIVSFPQLIEVMLAEKNADIDHLQQRVEELMTQRDNSGSKNQSKSRGGGNRVSFADDVTDSRLAEGERARDARVEHSSIKPYFSTPLNSIDEGRPRFAPRVVGEDLSKIPEPSEFVSAALPSRAIQLDSVLSQLKSELELKNVRLIECEAQLQERAMLEEELNKTKEELLETVKSVTEDKIFYEEQLNDLSSIKKLLEEREAELDEVKKELYEREKDIVKTKADVRALQTIMEGLQQKVQEAKTFARQQDDEVCGNNKMKLENEKLKDECDTYKTTLVSLEEQITDVKKALVEERKMRQELEHVVNELGKYKQEIVSELVETKSRCEFLQRELDKALSNNEETKRKSDQLSAALEKADGENVSLNTNCQKLKKEIEQLSKKQKTDMKNMLRRDSEEALKLKEELEGLKSSNSELQSQCESLQQELSDVGKNLDLLKEINQKDERISKMEVELKDLENNNQLLKEEKSKTEQSLSLEITGLMSLIGDLNKETELKDSEEDQHKEHKDTNLLKKYQILKREYDRQRRARKESEKKYVGLKSELAKEKRFTAQLQNQRSEKKTYNLEVSKAEIVDIKSEGLHPAGSLENLADQVQQELNASAQLDQSLISGLQSSASSEGVASGRSEKMPLRLEHLTARLAEMETALHVEKTVISELRAKVIKEHRLYMEARTQAEQFKQEVISLQTLNDQLEDKFKSIAHQLQEQVNEVKELRVNLEPADSNTPEKEKLKRLAAENQWRVEELLKEREFNKNQLLYLREELSKLWAEREKNKEDKAQRRDSNARESELNHLQHSLEVKKRELEEEQRKSRAMERLLQQANQTTDKQNQQLVGSSVQFSELCLKIDELNQKLAHETGLRRALETKIHTVELSEKNRHIRRKALESKLKDQLAQSEKIKKELERECLSLQLKLKHSNLQLTAHTAESPLSLRLSETNLVIERLVKEKEDLCAENTILKEEKLELLRKAREQASLVEDLKSQILALNVRVVDGGMDNLNAMFAAERAAWTKEKQELKQALAQKYNVSGESFNSFNNAAQLLQRYLRAESHRKALVWQKRYLMVSVRGYQEEERHTIEVLSRVHPQVPKPPSAPTAAHKFKAAVNAVRSVSRLRFLVEHRKRIHENTVQALRHAINNNVYPRRANHVPELQTLWRRTEVGPSTSSLQHGNMCQLLEQFNTIQDRIKNSLTSTT